jgi:hypothetical protein
MKKESLQTLVEEGMSTRELALHFQCSPTTVRYWLKKHSLKTKNLSFKDGYSTSDVPTMNDTEKYCPACDSWKPHNHFYRRKNRGNQLSGWCKACSYQSAHIRQKETKEKAVEYKGGKCSKCGYNKCIAALEFHHLDPSEKDPKWSNMKTRSFDKIKPELDKCVLLCANCHREEHYDS